MWTNLHLCWAGIFAMRVHQKKKRKKRREKLVCAMKWVWTYLCQYGSQLHVTLRSGSAFRSCYLCYYLRTPYLNICMEMFVWNRSRSFSQWSVPQLGRRREFIYILHVSGPTHSWVQFVLSKAPFSEAAYLFWLLLHLFTSLRPQSCPLGENITVNDHFHIFSLHRKQQYSMPLTNVCSFLLEWPCLKYLDNSTVKSVQVKLH